MSLRQNTVSKRLHVLGLGPRHIEPIIKLVNMWIAHNGFDWTIKRLKQIKVAYIQKLSSKKFDLDWITHNGQSIKGPFRPIWNLKNPNKALNALMIYTDLVSPKVTQSQWKKFSESAQQDNPFTKGILWPETFPNGRAVYHSTHYEFKFPQRLQSFRFKNLDMLSLKNIRTPQWSSDLMKPGANTPFNMARSFRHHLAVNYLYDNYNRREDFPEWFNNAIMKQFKDSREMIYDHARIDDFVGRISFIQEPGFKLRAVANPVMSLQILLDPLKQFVMNALKVIPQDYCHDQNQAIINIQSYLQNNPDKSLYSIDLSDATNNIPLKPQIQLLETFLGPKHPQLELFKSVSRGKWHVESPEGETEIVFNNGHGLGTGPSFGVFSLFHHYVVLCAICDVDDSPVALETFFKLLNQYNLETGSLKKDLILDTVLQPTHPYWIVGDDIVMSKKYAERYIYLMNIYYNVPISFDKCIFDSRTAEFCSRIISENSILHAFKWKSISDSNFLHIAKSLGPKSLPLFRRKQQKVLNEIGFIPDTLGGPVSWNPDGIPLGIRENDFWDKSQELLEIKSVDAPMERRSDQVYRFYRDLKIILSFGHDPLNVFLPSRSNSVTISSERKRDKGSESTVGSFSRQRDELYFKFRDACLSPRSEDTYSDKFIFMIMKMKDMDTISYMQLTQEERNSSIDWYNASIIDHISERDIYFEKLCNLYKIK